MRSARNVRQGEKFVQPSLEVLENRLAPSVSLLNGNLLVTGTVASLSITATSNTDYTVVADGTTTTESGVTGDIRVLLSGSAGSSVTVDLGGFTTGHDVIIRTGAGADTVTVQNGTVGHDLLIATGAGADTITLGDGSTALTVNHSVGVDAGANAGDTLSVQANVNIKDDLVSLYANTFTLAENAQVGDNAVIWGGSGGNTVTISGSVGNDLWFSGSSASGVTDKFTLSSTGSVGHNLTALTDGLFAYFGGGNQDTVTLDGKIGNSLYLDTGGGDDTVSLDGSVGGDAYVNTGAGNDQVTLGADLSVAGKAYISLGYGDDTLNYKVTGNLTAVIDGGPGTDTFALDSGITLPSTVTKKGFEK